MQTPIHIASAPEAAPLSAQQKKFNRQVERIAQQRQRLADWQQASAVYRERCARELAPLRQTHIGLLVELVQWLDSQSDSKALTKAERHTVSEAIIDRLADMLDAVPDEAMRESLKEIYNRHSGSDYDTEVAEGDEAARDLAQDLARELFGVDLDLQGADLDLPDELLRRLAEQMQAQQAQEAQAEQQRQAHRASRARKPSARERKAQEEATQATQSVREIYRKLASHLHPDRESDPAERERKTALMQRVNQAYANNRLLDLLQLQLEVEQIDPAHIAGLGEERLKHYNRVLAEQLSDLQQELERERAGFCIEFQLNPLQSEKPTSLMRELHQQVQAIEYENRLLGQNLRALCAGAAAFKRWIKVERQRLKAQDEQFPWF